jgi:hypothetical protein
MIVELAQKILKRLWKECLNNDGENSTRKNYKKLNIHGLKVDLSFSKEGEQIVTCSKTWFTHFVCFHHGYKYCDINVRIEDIILTVIK